MFEMKMFFSVGSVTRRGLIYNSGSVESDRHDGKHPRFIEKLQLHHMRIPPPNQTLLHIQ